MLKQLIESKEFDKIREALDQNPSLANEGMPYDEVNTTKAHPLHRLCDAVFNNKISDDEAVKIAEIFLEHGAHINGDNLKHHADTPLTAACSLNADKLALLYIERGADIHHAGCHGGTALHWSAWCGRPVPLKRLLKEDVAINQRSEDFDSTPLFWALHGYRHGDFKNREGHIECARLLIEAGADKSIPNVDGDAPIDLLYEEDVEMRKILE